MTTMRKIPTAMERVKNSGEDSELQTRGK